MFRFAIPPVVALGIVGCQSAVFAQEQEQPLRYISDLWQVYVSRCGLTIEDTQSFLETLPPTNSRGGPNAVMTADQALLVSSTPYNGFVVDADIFGVAEGLNVSCHVFPSESRFLELAEYSAADIELALVQFLNAQGLGRPSGGVIRNAFTGPQDGEELEYHYSIGILISGNSVLTRFEMTEGDLGVYFEGIFVPSNR